MILKVFFMEELVLFTPNLKYQFSVKMGADGLAIQNPN
jgi:hypothetical protein